MEEEMMIETNAVASALRYQGHTVSVHSTGSVFLEHQNNTAEIYLIAAEATKRRVEVSGFANGTLVTICE